MDFSLVNETCQGSCAFEDVERKGFVLSATQTSMLSTRHAETTKSNHSKQLRQKTQQRQESHLQHLDDCDWSGMERENESESESDSNNFCTPKGFRRLETSRGHKINVPSPASSTSSRSTASSTTSSITSLTSLTSLTSTSSSTSTMLRADGSIGCSLQQVENRMKNDYDVDSDTCDAWDARDEEDCCPPPRKRMRFSSNVEITNSRSQKNCVDTSYSAGSAGSARNASSADDSNSGAESCIVPIAPIAPIAPRKSSFRDGSKNKKMELTGRKRSRKAAFTSGVSMKSLSGTVGSSGSVDSVGQSAQNNTNKTKHSESSEKKNEKNEKNEKLTMGELEGFSLRYDTSSNIKILSKNNHHKNENKNENKNNFESGLNNNFYLSEKRKDLFIFGYIRTNCPKNLNLCEIIKKYYDGDVCSINLKANEIGPQCEQMPTMFIDVKGVSLVTPHEDASKTKALEKARARKKSQRRHKRRARRSPRIPKQIVDAKLIQVSLTLKREDCQSKDDMLYFGLIGFATNLINQDANVNSDDNDDDDTYLTYLTKEDLISTCVESKSSLEDLFENEGVACEKGFGSNCNAFGYRFSLPLGMEERMTTFPKSNRIYGIQLSKQSKLRSDDTNNQQSDHFKYYKTISLFGNGEITRHSRDTRLSLNVGDTIELTVDLEDRLLVMSKNGNYEADAVSVSKLLPNMDHVFYLCGHGCGCQHAWHDDEMGRCFDIKVKCLERKESFAQKYKEIDDDDEYEVKITLNPY